MFRKLNKKELLFVEARRDKWLDCAVKAQSEGSMRYAIEKAEEWETVLVTGAVATKDMYDVILSGVR